MGLNINFVNLTVDLLEREGFPKAKDALASADLKSALINAYDRAEGHPEGSHSYRFDDELRERIMEWYRRALDQMFNQPSPLLNTLREMERRERDVVNYSTNLGRRRNDLVGLDIGGPVEP